MKSGDEVREELERIRQGGSARYHEKAKEQGKLFCRDRLARLLDEDSFVEQAVFANVLAGDLPADGVVTGTGRIEGRTVCVMANDSTVKAGSWGKRTVEKILRIQECAQRLRCPMLYLVDSAGARITDQIEMFPGQINRSLQRPFCIPDGIMVVQVPPIKTIRRPSVRDTLYGIDLSAGLVAVHCFPCVINW